MRSIALGLGALLICGCVNLGAVREFAGQSAELTDYKAVSERYASSAARQLADAPPDRRFDATRAKLTEFQKTAAADKTTLLALHTATTGYLTALAALAGSEAYSLTPEIDKLGGAIAASEGLKIDATHVQAYSNIVKRVVSWATAVQQAKDVKTMVKTYGADIDTLLEAMELATQSYGVVFEQEAANTDAFAAFREAHWDASMPGDTNLTPGRREVISSLLRRSTVAQREAQASALRSQTAALAGLVKVRAAHQVLLRDIDDLESKQVQAMLKQASSDLKSIRKSLAAL